jgi:23S rRNA (uracil1939-C5)-methyltransferase
VKPRSRHSRPSVPPAPVVLDLAVEKLVPGGEGLARHQGKVIFVPGALPGEQVRARLVESRKDYARAEVEAVLRPSPDRISPPCPLAGRCGGCDWQHLSHEAQLRHKVSLVADALRRLGGLEWPGLAIEAGSPWGYRNRARLHPAGGGRLGFKERGGSAVIAAAACPVADPALEALLARGLPAPADAASGHRASLAGYQAWGRGGASALAASGPESGGPLPGDGAPSSGRGEAWPELSVPILGKDIRFDLRCFFQSNVEMTERLIPHALEGLSGGVAMDLYCGVGLFGAFLADRFRTVVAVEENPVSLAYARRNIPGTGHAFLEGRLEDLAARGLPGMPSGKAPEAVVVDPPRPGLDAAVRAWLAEARPPRLVYVSCNPVTLARDLKTLSGAGFRLDSLRLFDFYPQTAHVEAVARLST